MARAKRTARAEARRRHRALTAAAAAEEAEAIEGEEDDAPEADERVAPPPRTSRTSARRPGADPLRGGPPRPAPAGGIRNAFRLAFRPLNLREDLALLPRLVAHKAFWLPMLIASVVAGAVIGFEGRELISQFAMTYFLYPPPIGAIFLAGFLAPRASYLIGALVGIATSVLLAFVVASTPALFPGVTFVDGLVSGLSTSPVSGVLFGAAAAWYRRFLYLASPARQLERRGPAPRNQASAGKPARGARTR